MTVILDAKQRGTSFTATVQLANFTPAGTSEVWQLTAPGTAIAHLASPVGRNYVRVIVGDRVRVALMPNDPSRGRIVEKI